MLTKVIPERIHPLVRKARPQRVGPTLSQQPTVTLPGLGLQQRVFKPRARIVDIEIGRYDVVISRQHDGFSALAKGRRVAEEALEPGQFVVELWPRLRVPVRQVKR